MDIIDSSHEGIMWLHFQPTTDAKAFYFCVCYLPPSDSTRNIDHGEFYDTLLYQSFSHCNDELFYICGDFNGRCGDLEDYIAGVDCIPDRDVIDFTINKEGERLCDFLIDSNCCIMNGRNCLENNFTFVGTQGASVVDYCIMPYEHLSKYEAFRVCLTSDLLSKANLHNKINSAITVPDHSLLLWTFTVECTNVKKKKYAIGLPVTYEKYDRLVPDNFLQEDLSILNDGIRKIQQSVNTQEELDNVCSKLILTLKTEMNDKMTHRTVKIQPSGNNKKRKVNKPWWSDSLSELWNEQCKAEKAMLKGQKSIRNRLRHVFVAARKRFNREVQRAKRQYIRQKQAEIDELQSKNQTMFWKEIGKIGVGQERRKNIPLEILKPDGSVSSDVTEVLGKWESDFTSLLNPIESTSTPGPMNITHSTQNNENLSGYLQDPIQMTEIESALKRMKSNKATGIDEISMEVLKCRNIRQTLCVLFNKCFTLGKIPNMWKMGIITPVPKSSTSDTRDPLSYRGIHITSALYKLYCNILNERLSKWESELEILSDAQNGFQQDMGSDCISS